MLLFLSTNHSLFGNRVWSLCLWSSSSPRLSSSTEKAIGRGKHYQNKYFTLINQDEDNEDNNDIEEKRKITFWY